MGNGPPPQRTPPRGSDRVRSTDYASFQTISASWSTTVIIPPRGSYYDQEHGLVSVSALGVSRVMRYTKCTIRTYFLTYWLSRWSRLLNTLGVKFSLIMTPFCNGGPRTFATADWNPLLSDSRVVTVTSRDLSSTAASWIISVTGPGVPTTNYQRLPYYVVQRNSNILLETGEYTV